MPPKRKTLRPPQRSSERLKTKMSPTTNDKSSISPIDLSTRTPSPDKKNKRAKKPISPGPKDDETPIRHHLIVTNEDDVKRFEELDDCFILGFDPIEPTKVKKVFLAEKACVGSPEIAIVAEKGQVACRDYPHSRHQCIKFPFETTAHEKHCELCYCYVCDTAAPCKSWTCSSKGTLSSHCDAYDSNDIWRRERILMRKVSNVSRQ